MYSMSFEWYTLLGTLIVWVTAVVLSHTVARIEQPVDVALLSPLVRWMVPKATLEAKHIEMRPVSSRTDIGAEGGKDVTLVTETTYISRTN